MAAPRKYQVIVYGASGFTGLRVVRQCLSAGFRAIALAGRSGDTLRRARDRLRAELESASEIAALDEAGFLEASTESSPDVLQRMAGAAHVLIACAGPFRRHGRPVVAACVASGTHYVDISGEPQFMEEMEADYDEAARRAGVLVVSACGMDSIPCDLGVLRLEREFAKTHALLTSVKAVLSVDGPRGQPLINYGTWDSLVHSVANSAALTQLRRAHPKPRLAFKGEPLAAQGKFTREVASGSYVVPFLGADASVVRRSQLQACASDAARTPVRFEALLAVSSRFSVILFYVWGLLFWVLCSFGLGRRLLLGAPRLLSGGLISAEGPSAATRAATRCDVFLVGRGFSQADQANSDARARTDKQAALVWSFVDPGYEATAAMAAVAAHTIFTERARMPPGGVLTPATAFRATSLIDRLVGPVLLERSLP